MSDLVQQTRTRQGQQRSIQDMLAGGVRAGLDTALADRIGVERFMQAAVTTFRTTPGLARCSEASILGGLFTAAQLGLEVGGPRGLCYLVPYGSDATFVLGYKGLVELFYRTGQVRKVDAFLIRQGDRFRKHWDPAQGRVFDWEPGDDAAAEWVGVVAYVLTTSGDVIWEHLTKAEVLKRRPAKWTKGPWETWEEQMVLKTGLKALQRTVRQSTDDRSLAIAVESDQTVQKRLPGLTEHAVQRIPLEADAPAKEPAPAPASDDSTDAPTAGQEHSPMTLDDEAAHEERSAREYEDWLAARAEAEEEGA